MLFRTHYNGNQFEKKYERVDDTRLTESAGYISAKQRIENLIFAGQRLIQARAEQYDLSGEYTDEDEDNIRIDPTRRKDFDLADATTHLHELEAKKLAKKRDSVNAESSDHSSAPKNQQSQQNNAIAKDSKKEQPPE